MKLVKYDLDNNTYYLCFNGTAMFEINELLGEKRIIDLLTDNTAQSYQLTCQVLSILSEQGEAVRRYLGYDTQKPLTVDEILSIASPVDMLLMKNAIMKAVAIGYGKEINEDDEVDTGLIELQKKTDKTR